LIRPPASRFAPLTPEERQEVMRRSPVSGRYEETVDRESAYERLSARVAGAEPSAGSTPFPSDSARPPKPATRRAPSVVEAAAMSAARAIGSQVGRELIRGVLGSLLGGGSSSRRRR
jgi:hypothetical protein